MINAPGRSACDLGNVLDTQPVGFHQLLQAFMLGRVLVVLSHRTAIVTAPDPIRQAWGR